MSTITVTGLRDGQPHSTTAEIDDAEIARRKAAADARRTARSTPPLDGRVFLARLTDAEYTAIIAASIGNIQLARWIEMLRMVGTVNVTDAVAMEAKAALVAGGLLSQSRADQVFAP